MGAIEQERKKREAAEREFWAKRAIDEQERKKREAEEKERSTKVKQSRPRIVYTKAENRYPQRDRSSKNKD